MSSADSDGFFVWVSRESWEEWNVAMVKFCGKRVFMVKENFSEKTGGRK